SHDPASLSILPQRAKARWRLDGQHGRADVRARSRQAGEDPPDTFQNPAPQPGARGPSHDGARRSGRTACTAALGGVRQKRSQPMPWPRQALIDLLGIEHPIIQAPMAGASTVALAAAVSNAGALGGFGGSDSSPDEPREVIRAIPQKNNKPLIINLYLDGTEPYVSVAEHEAALKTALAPAHAELHAGEVPDPIDLFGKFDSQIAVLVEERVPVLSSHFGPPDATLLRALKANGTRVIATAT